MEAHAMSFNGILAKQMARTLSLKMQSRLRLRCVARAIGCAQLSNYEGERVWKSLKRLFAKVCR